MEKWNGCMIGLELALNLSFLFPFFPHFFEREILSNW
jgi:hypothetical protein